MEIEIKNIENQDKKVVTFCTAIGCGKGIWKDDQIPSIYNSYNVELTINSSKCYYISEKEIFSISAIQNIILFCGVVENIDNKGVAILRLQKDCIVQLQLQPYSIKVGMWLTIEVSANNVELYPY